MSAAILAAVLRALADQWSAPVIVLLAELCARREGLWRREARDLHLIALGTLDRAVAALEAAGLLRRERVQVGGGRPHTRLHATALTFRALALPRDHRHPAFKGELST
jgi:DNA-binding HxlR family transcriptional regulator